MAQNVILQDSDIERSRSFVKVNCFFIKPPPFTRKYMCEVSLKTYCQIFCYGVEQSLTKRWRGERIRKEGLK